MNSHRSFFKLCQLGLCLIGLATNACVYARTPATPPLQNTGIEADANALQSNVKCEVVLTTDDAPRFHVPEIDIPFACHTFTVILKHTGRLPKSATGHNWVLVATQKVNAVTHDGSKAGVNQHYIKPRDERVIAFIPIVGRGETAEVSFSTALLLPDESYTFLSTVDGQSAIMRGVIRRF